MPATSMYRQPYAQGLEIEKFWVTTADPRGTGYSSFREAGVI